MKIFEKYSTHAILAISVLYALIAPIFFPGLDFFWIITGSVAIIAILSKKWVDFLIVVFLQLNMLLHIQLYPEMSDFRHIAQVTAFSAYNMLCLTLVMGPLARMSKFFAKQLKHRRHIGVSVFLLGLTHAMFVISQYYEFDIESLYAIKANYFGAVGLLIFSALAITSMDSIKNKLSLRNYGLLHSLLFLGYVFYTMYVVIFTQPPFKTWNLIVIFLIGIVWLLLNPLGLPKRIFERVNGWKQLHYLVFLGFLSVAVHAWIGFFVLQPIPMQMSFWATTNTVIFIIIIGWIRRFHLARKKTNDNQ